MGDIMDAVNKWRRGTCEEDGALVQPEEHRMGSQELQSLCESAFPGVKLYAWDRWYYYLDNEEWGAVLEDALLGMPEYTKSRFDCENFATLCTCRVSSRCLINTMGIAIGSHNGQAHGFNVFVSAVDGQPTLNILEPQTGMVCTPEEPEGYEVDYVIFG